MGSLFCSEELRFYVKKKVAFVHYPHGVDAARFDTMPFALNSVVALANSGWEVDLFLWENLNTDYARILPKNVNIKYNEEIDNFSIINRILNKPKIRSRLLYLQFRECSDYSCAFGLGQIGAYIASIISIVSRCPFIYYNDEFPSCWGNGIWSQIERRVVEQAIMIVVPDEQRFLQLSLELNIRDKPYAALPNIPIKTSIENIDWHQRLNIPADNTPFLHAGSVADWSQVPEILSSVPYWEEKTSLIIHSRSTEGLLKYKQQLSHLNIPNRIVWSLDPMSDTTLNSLVHYCAGNFALYRNTGPNIEYMGFSSGKLMRSLVYGSPVIASSLSSLKFVEDNKLGFLVSHPAEIPNAVKSILYNREIYSQNCLDFCRTRVSFEKGWTDFCCHLKEITGLNLS